MTRSNIYKSAKFQIALVTFGVLSLELTLIRWISGQIRTFAYFNNLILIASFLGFGLGVALGEKKRGLIHWMLPALFALSIPVAFSERLGLVHLAFPDQSIAMWGVEIWSGHIFSFVLNLSVFLLLFFAVVFVFVGAASPLGYLFSELPTLKAYSADLLGSILGILVFTGITFLNATPPIWLIISTLPFVWLSQKRMAIFAFIGIVFLAGYSVKGALYSPYNRIDIQHEGPDVSVAVNRDFHQIMRDFSDTSLSEPSLPPETRKTLLYFRDAYDLPFKINDVRHRALIVGAGTGNDVKAALRNHYGTVYSDDIDGQIIKLGKQLHPERPYDDPRVVPIVNDARAFFEQHQGEKFDVICYGLLDSHAMFSSMSSLRLDNYVYTEEGIRSAWNHVSEDGHLSISFSVYAGRWIADRMYWTIAKATGKEPIFIYHGMQYGATFIVPRDRTQLHLDRFPLFSRAMPSQGVQTVRTTSDNWPFLYIHPGKIPWAYIIVLTFILLASTGLTVTAFGGRRLLSNFDPTLFFMGAAFLLLETRGVTLLSLLFGSTWIVNSAVFLAILILVLLANLCVDRFQYQRVERWFIPLFLSLLLMGICNLAWLYEFPLIVRGLIGGLLIALPIGFAGVIVSLLLKRSSNPSAALGSNLIGAVLGGSLEYLSMLMGLQALIVLAFAFYGAAALCYRWPFTRRPESPTIK